jgi:hypothetical protein
VTFGTGPEADAERLQLAVVSNTGGVSLSKADRVALEVRLYDQGNGKTMDEIAKIVGVNKSTVSYDLRDVVAQATTSSRVPKTDKLGRENNTGRRKKVRAKKSDGKEDAILAQPGVSSTVVAADVGVPPREVRRVRKTQEIIEQAKAEPNIDPDILLKTHKEKLALAIKQHVKELDIQFESRVLAEIKRRLEATVLPHYKETERHYEAVIKHRKGVFTMEEYNLILHCTHTDSRKSLSNERMDQALHLMQNNKLVLVAEKENPTRTVNIPSTYDELMKQKADADARRKAERQPKQEA